MNLNLVFIYCSMLINHTLTDSVSLSSKEYTQRSAAQRSTAQHSTAQRSAAQHSTAQHSIKPPHVTLRIEYHLEKRVPCAELGADCLRSPARVA